MSNLEQVHARFLAEPGFFAECVEYTARQTGFRPELVEKDYYCSLLLEALGRVAGQRLVFKGGTCLRKVYAGFYRMSEDLDFVIPVATNTLRAERRRLIEPMKRAWETLPTGYAGLKVSEVLRGSNESTQYLGAFTYPSMFANHPERIQVEIGLREPLLLPAEKCMAQTLLANKITKEAAVQPFPVRAIALEESLAEKIRAALTRREPAIRDFFDLDHAMRRLGLRLTTPTLRDLVRRKLSVPGNAPVNLSAERRATLEQQIETELKPVLRPQDYDAFSLERVFSRLAAVDWVTQA